MLRSLPCDPVPQRFVVGAPDLFASSFVAEKILELWPKASVILAPSIRELVRQVENDGCDIVVTDIAFADGDLFDHLMELRQTVNPMPRVLVVTRCRDYRTCQLLHLVPVEGVFYSDGNARALMAALREVSELTEFRRVARDQKSVVGTAEPDFDLTPSEELVLTLVGDGSDDRAAATTIGISPASVLALRRSLHRKLRVQHRGELIRKAVELGYVRFVAGSVVQPGLRLMLRARARKRQKLATLAA